MLTHYEVAEKDKKRRKSLYKHRNYLTVAPE
jgi:hypothetical protein